MSIAGSVLFGFGAFVTVTNFSLSWVRPVVHRLLGGTRETYRWISGIPLIGSLSLWLSIPLLPEPVAWIAAGLSFFDTGGIHWFIATMWLTRQLWPFAQSDASDMSDQRRADTR